MKVSIHTTNEKILAYSNQEFAELAQLKYGGELKTIEVAKIDTITEDHIEIELTDRLDMNTIYIRPTVNDGEETQISYDYNFIIEPNENEYDETVSYSISSSDFDNTFASNELKKIVNNLIEDKLLYLEC